MSSAPWPIKLVHPATEESLIWSHKRLLVGSTPVSGASCTNSPGLGRCFLFVGRLVVVPTDEAQVRSTPHGLTSPPMPEPASLALNATGVAHIRMEWLASIAPLDSWRVIPVLRVRNPVLRQEGDFG